MLFAFGMYYLRMNSAPPIIFVSATLVGMILMTLLFQTNWRERLAYSSLLTVFGFVSEIASGYLIIAFIGVTYEYIAADQRLFTIGVILSKLIHFIIGRIIMRVVKRKTDPTPLRYWAGSLIIPVVSIAVMHGLAVISDCFLQKDITVILLSIGGILFLNMTWFAVYDCMVAHASRELSTQKEIGLRLSEKSKFTAMMQHGREMAAHVHDFKHHIGVLSSLLTTGEYCEATEYVKKISTRHSLFEGGSFVPNHKSVDMVLRQKIAEAERNGIEVTHNISMPPQISVDYMTLCIVLANALDNAVEACVKVDGEKKIYINIFSMHNTLSIKILNTSNYVEIIGGEIKTTKSEKQNHGFGLSNMGRVVKDAGGNMVFNHNKGMFSLYIIFPL